jgi:hypothetical protein
MSDGRVARGMNEELCGQCKTGLGWPQPIKTFNPKCSGCQAKKDRGLRTGLEPMPEMSPAARRKRMSNEQFAKMLTRVEAEKEGRRRARG